MTAVNVIPNRSNHTEEDIWFQHSNIESLYDHLQPKDQIFVWRARQSREQNDSINMLKGHIHDCSWEMWSRQQNVTCWNIPIKGEKQAQFQSSQRTRGLNQASMIHMSFKTWRTDHKVKAGYKSKEKHHWLGWRLDWNSQQCIWLHELNPKWNYYQTHLFNQWTRLP